jgi:hypothetical protein
MFVRPVGETEERHECALWIFLPEMEGFMQFGEGDISL